MKISLLEGNRFQLDGGAMFGNIPKALWEQWVPANEKNRIPMTTRCFLIETDENKRVLIEAGIGAFFDPKMKERYDVEGEENALIVQLKQRGIEPEDIDEIVLTHLHFDHAGGILTDYGKGPLKLAFPKAFYNVGKMHWDHANNPPIGEKASFVPEMIELLERSGKLRLIEKDFYFQMPMKPHFFHGHTVGLMVLQLNLPIATVWIGTDLVPATPWIRLSVGMGYDRYSELVAKEKQRLYTQILGQDHYLFLMHDLETPFVKVTYQGAGLYEYAPHDLPADA